MVVGGGENVPLYSSCGVRLAPSAALTEALSSVVNSVTTDFFISAVSQAGNELRSTVCFFLVATL